MRFYRVSDDLRALPVDHALINELFRPAQLLDHNGDRGFDDPSANA